ncbi:MAG: TetR family transcriptional regulator [Acidobacteriia bacterium]|nr:TetR family transcriptional regulator [Terriglobia bacterium]
MTHTSTAAPDSATTDRLFDTAAELFWRQGFGATTTREIAAALGIQQASLYHHIASKEDLLYRICVSSLEPFLADVPAKVNQAKCPLERIQVFIHAHLTTLLQHQQRNVTQLTESRSLSARHRAEVLALRDKYEHFSRSTLENAQTAGAIRGDVPAKYLNLELMSILNHASLWFRRGRALAEDQLAEMFTKVFLDGAAAPSVRPRVTLPDLAVDRKKGVEEKKPARARKTPLVPDNPALSRALDAAVGLFSRKGYAATSTREVAGILGIQKATLYYHVESKEDLLFLICQSSLTQIQNDVETAIRDIHDPLERTQALICSHIESLLRDEAKHATTFTEMHALSEKRFEQVMKLRDAYENFVRSVLQEARDAGVLRQDIEVKYLSLALLGIMNRVTVWYRRDGPLSPNQVGRLLAALFLSGAAAVNV